MLSVFWKNPSFKIHDLSKINKVKRGLASIEDDSAVKDQEKFTTQERLVIWKCERLLSPNNSQVAISEWEYIKNQMVVITEKEVLLLFNTFK